MSIKDLLSSRRNFSARDADAITVSTEKTATNYDYFRARRRTMAGKLMGESKLRAS
jgi:hypothetical protein